MRFKVWHIHQSELLGGLLLFISLTDKQYFLRAGAVLSPL